MPDKLVPYNDTEIYESELDFIHQIEQVTRKKFWLVEDVQKAYKMLMDTSIYFSVKNNHIIEIDLHKAGLESLPETIGNLIYLRRLDLAVNNLSDLLIKRLRPIDGVASKAKWRKPG